MKRRDFLKKLGIGVAVAPTLPAILSETAKAEPLVYTPEKPNYGNASASSWTPSTGSVKYIQATSDGPVPAGTLTEANWCPDGCVPTDGRVLSRNEYRELYAIIGHKYGGSGDEFRVPDLRAAVMPYMVRSAFTDFPGKSGVPHYVELKVR